MIFILIVVKNNVSGVSVTKLGIKHGQTDTNKFLQHWKNQQINQQISNGPNRKFEIAELLSAYLKILGQSHEHLGKASDITLSDTEIPYNIMKHLYRRRDEQNPTSGPVAQWNRELPPFCNSDVLMREFLKTADTRDASSLPTSEESPMEEIFLLSKQPDILHFLSQRSVKRHLPFYKFGLYNDFPSLRPGKREKIGSSDDNMSGIMPILRPGKR